MNKITSQRFQLSLVTLITVIGTMTPQSAISAERIAVQPKATAQSKSRSLSELEQAIIRETNRVRSNPKAYAAELAVMKQYYKGNLLKLPGSLPLQMNEGASVVDDAIQALQSTPPLAPLAVSQGLSLGARDHVNDLAPKGKVGHYGTDGSDPFKRMNRYGTWQGVAGENISFSPIATAKWHVMQLVLDDGVKSRGHRKAILNREYRLIGAACDAHAVYGQMCVMTYTQQYIEGKSL